LPRDVKTGVIEAASPVSTPGVATRTCSSALLDRQSLGSSAGGLLRCEFAREAAHTPFDVVVDFVWGRPTEALVAALSRTGLTHAAPRVRLVEVGESAGPTISLPADVLRSSGLELVGSGAGTIPVEEIMTALPEVIERAARGELRADPEVVSLSEIEGPGSVETVSGDGS
jgi:hypothetical protein